MSDEKRTIAQFLTLKEAAKKWRTNPGYLRKACELGQVSGAAKLGDEWIVPADMERPPMKIPRDNPSPKKVEHGSDYKDAIYRMTMKGFPDFNVMTHTIGRTTYVVYSSFSPSARETLEEKMFRLAMRNASEDLGLPASPIDKEAMRKIREDALNRMPSNEKLREYYHNKFVEIGFNEEELDVLMAKIDEHIATRNEALNRNHP